MRYLNGDLSLGFFPFTSPVRWRGADRENRRIAVLLARGDENIPFTILAFFPQHEMRHVPPPTLEQMVSAYEAARAAWTRQVRLGNLGVLGIIGGVLVFAKPNISGSCMLIGYPSSAHFTGAMERYNGQSSQPTW